MKKPIFVWLLSLLFSGLFLFALFVLFWPKLWPTFLHDHQVLTFDVKEHLFAKPARQLRLEVVTSSTSIQEGLANRESLVSQDGEAIDGMLFVFPGGSYAVFWMKGMQFPLDICWLRDGNLLSCDTAQAEEREESGKYRRLNSPGKIEAVLEVVPGALADWQEDWQLFPSQLFSLL